MAGNGFHVLFKNISVISRQWQADNDRLYAIKSRLPVYGLKEFRLEQPGRVAQSVGHQTRKSGVLGWIPGLATYFRFSFRFFKKGSCQLLAKVCARSTG